MINFISNIKNSIWGPPFYQNLNNQKTSFTIYYASKLSILLTFIFLAFSTFGWFRVFDISDFSSQNISNLGRNYLQKNFPDTLVLNVRDGKLTSNSKEPIFFPIPNLQNLSEEDTKDVLENFAVIDTNKDFNLSILKDYSTYALLAHDNAGVYDESKQKLQMLSYSDFQKNFPTSSGEINKKQALLIYETLASYIKRILPYIFVFGILFGILGMFMWICLGILIFALFTGLLAFLLTRFTKYRKSLGEWYLIAIHADTLPVILLYTLGLLINIFYITFSYTLLVLILVYLNAKDNR